MMSRTQLAELHDARLIGITYELNSIRLDFQKVDSRTSRLILTNIVSFFCTNMLDGNIVESVEVLTAGDIAPDDVAYFAKKEGKGQFPDTLMQAIASKMLSMILLAPSYGAELGCICGGFKYEETETSPT